MNEKKLFDSIYTPDTQTPKWYIKDKKSIFIIGFLFKTNLSQRLTIEQVMKHCWIEKY